MAYKSDLRTSLREVAPGSFSTQTRATSGCRCGEVALELERLRLVALGGRSETSDLVLSLW
ncbi:hypothetical protein DY000_02032398 [Brassica cretica]|uniref:Uncharacterized protein n=1 Tax=Brassica cretica TaxID=69181 RepID=A0ABQ7DP91_BRACR|nr:hypothetical protein DY000_02032398 [Brassica cretica]